MAMTNEELEIALVEHADMWGKDKEHYMLLPREEERNGRARHGIIDLRNNHYVLIERAELASRIVQCMLDAGVPVGSPFDPKIKKELIRQRLKGAK